jgi:hypothetical protein
MMVLPSQFDEALRNPRSMGPICSLEVSGSRLVAVYGKKGRHRIEILHHKEAAGPSQPCPVA